MKLAELHTRGGHAVPAAPKSPSGASNVYASRITCGVSYAGVGLPYKPHFTPRPRDRTANPILMWRKLGALTWFLCDPCTPVGAPASRHPREHVEGVTGPVAYLTMPTKTRNPLTLLW